MNESRRSPSDLGRGSAARRAYGLAGDRRKGRPLPGQGWSRISSASSPRDLVGYIRYRGKPRGYRTFKLSCDPCYPFEHLTLRKSYEEAFSPRYLRRPRRCSLLAQAQPDVSYSLGMIIGPQSEGQQPQDRLRLLRSGHQGRPWRKTDQVYGRAGPVRRPSRPPGRGRQERRREPGGGQDLPGRERQAGVTTTASGLQYEVLVAGTGPKPKATDTVKVNYEGKLHLTAPFSTAPTPGTPRRPSPSAESSAAGPRRRAADARREQVPPLRSLRTRLRSEGRGQHNRPERRPS